MGNPPNTSSLILNGHNLLDFGNGAIDNFSPAEEGFMVLTDQHEAFQWLKDKKENPLHRHAPLNRRVDANSHKMVDLAPGRTHTLTTTNVYRPRDQARIKRAPNVMSTDHSGGTVSSGEDFFTHGMLYVALSRVSNQNAMAFLLNNEKTKSNTVSSKRTCRHETSNQDTHPKTFCHRKHTAYASVSTRRYLRLNDRLKNYFVVGDTRTHHHHAL